VKRLFKVMLALIVAVPFVAGFAGSSYAEHPSGGEHPAADSAATCAHMKSGDKASVLMDASKALEASHPELAAKVKTIADDCCKLGLHDAPAQAAASEHPAGSSSEHPSDHPTS